jgi:hypothetical protein
LSKKKIYPRNRQLVLDLRDGLFGGRDFDGRLNLVVQYTLLGASRYVLELFNVDGCVVDKEKVKILILLDGILVNDFGIAKFERTRDIFVIRRIHEITPGTDEKDRSVPRVNDNSMNPEIDEREARVDVVDEGLYVEYDEIDRAS